MHYDVVIIGGGKEFDLKELFEILPASDYALLLEEAAYFVGESIVDEVRSWFGLEAPDPIGNGTRNPGFDFG